jgi:hypothetical protein
MSTQNGGETRICPYCAEQIKAAAKICPKCRQWLTALSLRNPGMAVVVMCSCMFLLIGGALLWLARLTDNGSDFSPYRDRITIVESRMSFGKSQDGTPVVNTVAVVTNRSDIAWKGIEFDSRFFNKAGVLIDAHPWRSYTTVLPHSDAAVRFATKPITDFSEYETQKVYIRAARDARAHFD